MSKKQTIAVDIDDVLALSVSRFIEWSNKNFGTNIEYQNYVEDWSKLWGISQVETSKRVQKMYDDNIQEGYYHIEEAVEVLNILKNDYKLIITTARRREAHIQTRHWIEKNYRQVFKDIHFAGIWDEITEDSHKKTKTKLCIELGVDYLIDDQAKHCIGANDAGVTALLFGDYPWNKNISLPKGIEKVENWQKIEKYFESAR